MTTIVPSFDARDYALSCDAATRKRWGTSFIIILAVHGCVALAAITWQSEVLSPLAPPPAVLIDMTPTPPAPTVQPKVEPVKPKELPVVEKAEVVLKKKTSDPEKPKPKPAPEKKFEAQRVETKPAASKLSEAPIEAKPAVERNYLSVLYEHLERYKKAPRHFGVMDERVVVKALIRRDGKLLSLALKTSSGSEKYDEAALRTLQRADPLPAFPDEMTMSEKVFTIPILFKED